MRFLLPLLLTIAPGFAELPPDKGPMALQSLPGARFRFGGIAGSRIEANAIGAQHPSGRWCTYNTPMHGDRKASAHDIVFQARAETPELNCCSVNGPRVPGMLADWAVMAGAGGLVLNWHGSAEIATQDPEGSPVTLKCESNYPADGRVTWRIASHGRLNVRFRIPAWAEGATASIAGETTPPEPGSYFEIERVWKRSDPVVLEFPMQLRPAPGQREQSGKVSLFRGPLLLAWDQGDNDMDEFRIPRLDPARLTATVVKGEPIPSLAPCQPWILVELQTPRGPLRLRDFATAGMNGTRYRQWLRAVSTAPDKTGEPPALRADMKSGPNPESGNLLRTTTFTPANEAVQLDGMGGILVYALPEHFGAGDFTVATAK